MSLGALYSMLYSWLNFIWSTVLPVAFREVLHWIYEWQILLTGILAILAARIWGRSVIHAARISARAKVMTSFDVKRAPGEPVVVPVPLATSAGAPVVAKTAPTSPPRQPGLQDKLFALREMIRVALGRLPCTDEVLTAERLAECKQIAQFPLGELPAGTAKVMAHRFDVLRSELSALGAVRETDTCRNAWEALVRISMDARDLMGKQPTKTASK